jgi:hypothetical protein
MKKMQLAMQEPDPLAASQLRRAAKNYLHSEKNRSWKEFINNCASNRTHFKLAQAIYNKEFIKIKGKKFNFPNSTAKTPVVNDSIENTETIWRD